MSTWEEAERATCRAMLAIAANLFGYSNMSWVPNEYYTHVQNHYPAFYREYHVVDRRRFATVHGWSRLTVSARLCMHRLRGWDDHNELHFILGNRLVLFPRYLLDRVTNSELARVVAHTSYWDYSHAGRDRAIAQQELDLRARGAFECSSLGQLPLPSELVQLVGQFHSPAITPTRPARLRPPSYTAAVAVIRAELSAAPDTVSGHARAASQMDELHKKQRRA